MFKIRGARLRPTTSRRQWWDGQYRSGQSREGAQDDPLLRAAHFTFVVDQSLEAHIMDEFEGNMPENFSGKPGKHTK